MPIDPKFWGEVLVETLTLFAMLVGIFGLIVPIFPGLVVIWLAGLGFGIVSGFSTLGWVMFAFMTILMVIGNLADNVLMGAKARQGGASWVSIGLALVAGVIGSLAWPPIGGLLTAPLALFLAEYMRRRNWPDSWKATSGLMIGCGWSFIVRFIIGIIMTGLWMIWAWA